MNKSKIMIRAFFVCGVLAAAMFSPGCGRKSGGTGSPATDSAKTTIRVAWWGGDNRRNATLEAVKLFEQANPDIAVILEYMERDKYWDNLAGQVAGGTAADVIQCGGNYPGYVAQDALLELEQYTGNLLDVSRFDQDALETGSMNGHLYGVCLGTATLALVYNKSLLEKSGAGLPKDPMTWNELRLYALSIMPHLLPGVYPLVDNSSDQTDYMTYFLRQNNAPLYRGGASQAAVEDFAQWIAFWENLRADQLIPDIETAGSYPETGPESSMLTAGKAVIGLILSNRFGMYQEATTDELDFIQVPDIEKNALWKQPTRYLCVNKKSADPKAAVRFISFFVNNPEVGKMLGADLGISSSQPVREALAANAGGNGKKLYAFYEVAASHTTPMDPSLPDDQEFNNTFKLITQRVAAGQLTVHQGAEQIYRVVQQQLKK
ncbi:MAG: extracellular solute-binding protein [Treponema sp.]|jgi:multiple sugar transport system substrate-binding protein|nr:extracellular solute-binding protein [Treponema sp.]